MLEATSRRLCFCIFSVVVYGLLTYPSSATERTDAELRCLALTVYHESRGEPDSGKLAVAYVVLNRTRDMRFPREICDVVYQSSADGRGGCEFSWTCDARSDQPTNLASWQDSVRIARLAYWRHALDPTNGAMWYHADYVEPKWAATLSVPQEIGQHLFYRANGAPLAPVPVAPEQARPLTRKAIATGVVPEAPALRLPEATKTFLLELRVTMMIYVPTLRDRAVRINDIMYRQGDELAPGLALASITSTAIVVRYQDRWFRFMF